MKEDWSAFFFFFFPFFFLNGIVTMVTTRSCDTLDAGKWYPDCLLLLLIHHLLNLGTNIAKVASMYDTWKINTKKIRYMQHAWKNENVLLKRNTCVLIYAHTEPNRLLHSLSKRPRRATVQKLLSYKERN